MKKKYLKNNRPEKVIFVSGKFNIVHPGHLRLLNFAKTCGDKLIVGLLSDESDGVVVGIEDRKAAVESLEAVNEVVVTPPGGLSDLLNLLKPDVVVKGREYARQFNLEKEIVKSYGGVLLFSGGDVTFSSRDLIKKEILKQNVFELESESKFLNSRNSSHEKLTMLMQKFENKKGLIIGDVILDEYVYCDAIGMSQEDPTIVVSPSEKKTFLGGAGIVAAHIVGLGATADLITICGQDATAEIIEQNLSEYQVGSYCVRDDSRPSILKQRFKAEAKTLLRVSHLRSHDISDELVNEILHIFVKKLPDIDFLVFSDFNYGALPQVLVEKLIELCKHRNIPYFVDSQSSSQVGDVSRFKGAEIIFATEREARIAMNDQKSGLQVVANNLICRAEGSKLFLKLGSEGVIILSDIVKFETELIQAFNSNPKDVAGAGDAMLATAVLANCSGASIWEAGYLASIAAAIQVSRAGNIPLQREELLSCFRVTNFESNNYQRSNSRTTCAD